MKLLYPGATERAWHPDLRRVVDVVYGIRPLTFYDGRVKVSTLVGYHEETDTDLVLPHQSASDIGAAIREQAPDIWMEMGKAAGITDD